MSQNSEDDHLELMGEEPVTLDTVVSSFATLRRDHLALKKSHGELKVSHDKVLNTLNAGFTATNVLFGKFDNAVHTLARNAGVPYEVRTRVRSLTFSFPYLLSLVSSN